MMSIAGNGALESVTAPVELDESLLKTKKEDEKKKTQFKIVKIQVSNESLKDQFLSIIKEHIKKIENCIPKKLILIISFQI